MIPKKYLGAIYAFIAAICFSSKAILVKLVYQYNVDAVSSLTLRMAFSMPFFLVLAWVYRNDPYPIPENKPKKVDYFALVVLGIIGYYLSSLFDFMGLQYISTGLERLIVFIYPTLVVIIAAIIFKRRIQAFEILSLVFCSYSTMTFYCLTNQIQP
jgi:drug/metabolite transporter (DMT)-like permease